MGHPDEIEETVAELQRLLATQFSLTGTEARTFIALVRLGSATARQLAQLTKITQPNLYPALDSLANQGLCQRVPGPAAVWMVHSRRELLDRLAAAETERLRSAAETLKQSTEKIGALLSEIPEGADSSTSAIRFADNVQLASMYDEWIAAAKTEILVWTRGPSPGESEVSEPVADALARGVRARAMWQVHELQDPAAEADRQLFDAYAALGVEQRVAERLPLTLAVIDRQMALVAVPGDGDIPFPTNLVVQSHPLVETLALAFDQI